MYRRPKFLEILLELREEMSREADYDVDLFAEIIRSGKPSESRKLYDLSENGGNGAKPRVKRIKKEKLNKLK